ncbi:hypothetical protein DACRYDRAFT_44346, partial [Dacryopinax primogenitus]
KYKPADRCMKPVSTTTPESVKIQRCFPSDPLAMLPPLPDTPLTFIPRKLLTLEQFKELNINKYGFLWPEEEKLVAWVLHTHEKVFTWNKQEMGLFCSDYFDPVRIPMIEHIPWQQKNIPVPPALLPKVLKALQDKLNAGIYEPSQTSY